jgi:hypothetical protein
LLEEGLMKLELVSRQSRPMRVGFFNSFEALKDETADFLAGVGLPRLVVDW